ncbi:MAG: hypothetical protein H7A55_12485 [Verrucomicrobiaceae bacterium]|nr:hypothetical protein [Verrucomicrobiaceae bacterium]
MNLQRLLFATLSVAGLFFADTVRGQEAARTWTNTQGKTVVAGFGGVEDGKVILKMANGQSVPVALDQLSAADQAFVKAQATAVPAPTASGAGQPSPGRIPVDKRVWPETVAVPTKSLDIAVVSESAPDRKYIYRSESFEFTSQAKLAGSVMKEVARTFEATKTLVSQLPWGVECKPPVGLERYQAALYETRADYVAAGGPENSGGVYMSGDKIFKIPFPSLGMEKRGQTYFKNDNYRADTLVHEITHQMMHDYLGYLPQWIIEGTAEYTEMLPYNAGSFRADGWKGAFKDYLGDRAKYGYDPEIGSLEKHMTMNREQWGAEANTSNLAMGKLYNRSLLLVFYFNHLDGDKKGTRFMKFFEAVYGEVLKERAFFADPRVKMLDGGRYSYPRELTPPDKDRETAPFKFLDILLDGRSYEDLAKEITEGYKSIGAKVSVN